MKPLLLPHAALPTMLLSTLLLASGLAWAQASGPGRQGYGAGYHARQMGGAAATGRALMTPAERDAHRTAIAATPNQDECRLLQSQQRQQLSARAQERGVAEPTPRRDACAAKQP